MITIKSITSHSVPSSLLQVEADTSQPADTPFHSHTARPHPHTHPQSAAPASPAAAALGSLAVSVAAVAGPDSSRDHTYQLLDSQQKERRWFAPQAPTLMPARWIFVPFASAVLLCDDFGSPGPCSTRTSLFCRAGLRRCLVLQCTGRRALHGRSVEACSQRRARCHSLSGWNRQPWVRGSRLGLIWRCDCRNYFYVLVWIET